MSPCFIVTLFAGLTASNSRSDPSKATGLVRKCPSDTPRRNHDRRSDRHHNHRNHHHHRRHHNHHQEQMIHNNNNTNTNGTNNSSNNNSSSSNNNNNSNTDNNSINNAGANNPDPVQESKDAKETAEDSAVLRRFKIVQLIGTGNYARVYRGLSQSGRELAIKSINLSKTTDNYKYKFLPRELTILKRITHPNICKIYEITQVSDRVFIIMQFCSRGTIADLLHHCGPLNEPVTRYLFVPTAEAVHYLHAMHFSHRDLKLENILLDHDYNPKLTDFSYSVSFASSSEKSFASKTVRSPTIVANSQGLSLGKQHSGPSRNSSPGPAGGVQSSRCAAIHTSKLNETFCGTLPYLSPEMIRRQPYDSKKTDMWSLGVCLYIMLNDKAPFLFDDIKSMVKKQLSCDFKFRTNVEFSPEVRELVSLMLEPDYTKRISSHEVVRHIWTQGEREKPSSHLPLSHGNSSP